MLAEHSHERPTMGLELRVSGPLCACAPSHTVLRLNKQAVCERHVLERVRTRILLAGR